MYSEQVIIVKKTQHDDAGVILTVHYPITYLNKVIFYHITDKQLPHLET